MKTKIIGVVSVLVLLNACSPKEDDPATSTSISSAASSIASSITLEASSAAYETSSAAFDISSAAISSVEGGTGQDATLTEPAALLNTQWKLIVLNSSDVTTSANQPEPHLIFSTDNRVAGSDGCNNLTGSYTLEGDKLKLSEVASTKMACLQGSEQADALQQALGKVTSFSIHADQLELRDETGLVLARFKAVAQS